jgi:hypothetical protein
LAGEIEQKKIESETEEEAISVRLLPLPAFRV